DLFRDARRHRRQGARDSWRRRAGEHAGNSAQAHRFRHSHWRCAVRDRRTPALPASAARREEGRLRRHRIAGSARPRRDRRESREEKPMTITLMLIGMLALAVLNVPIAVALGFVAMMAIIIIQGAQMLPNLALVMLDGASSFPLIAIPLFILSGAIMNASSISRRLIAFASALVG